MVALAIGTWGVMLLARAVAHRVPGPTPVWAARWVSVVVVVVTLLAAAGTLVQVARIGHSGAEATWSDVSGQGLQCAQAAGPAALAVRQSVPTSRPCSKARG